jgi:phage baseplate assembly protein W
MTWDFKFSQGDLVINELKQLERVTDAEKAKQHVWFILKTVKGTDLFNPEFGVDWLKIKRSGFNRKLTEHEIRKALSSYDKIKSIDGIEISEPDSEGRVSIKLSLTLDEGKIETEVIV